MGEIIYGIFMVQFDFELEKIASEYDQEIPQSQATDNPMAL